MNRANHFDVLRLVAAAAVAMLHLIDLTRLPTFERWLGWLPLQFGLPVFFVLSGYLVSMSWGLRPGWRPYAQRRLRRIVPAYVVVVLVCAVGGVLLSTESWRAYFSAPAWWRHLVANLTFLNFLQPGLPGVFAGNPLPGTVNGALWTIKVELMFYAVVPLFMGAVRRWGATPVLLIGYVLSACWWTFFTDWAVQSGRPVGHEIAKQMPGQLMYFLAGAWAWCERERVARWGAAWGLGGLLVLACLTWLDGPRTEGADLPDVLVPACLAAFVSWLAVGVRPQPALALRHDLSYGIYLWHFPVIQTLVSVGAFQVAPWSAALLVAVLVPLIAWASWRWIEEPALRRRAVVAPVPVAP